jgi:hypothetical protein
MIVENMLSRLHGVRKTGPDRWLACCPAHDDRRASLAIRKLDDGRLLVHDFAGCSVHEIVHAAGLSLADLFPTQRRPGHRAGPERRPFPAADVLRALAHEATIVAIAASRIANGGSLVDGDRSRLRLAAGRIVTAVRETGHA